MRFITTPDSRPGRSCLRAVLACALAACALASQAQSADKAAEKTARRMQLQLQNLQQQLTEAQAATARVEADKAAVDKALLEREKEVVGLKGALRQANDKSKQQEQARVQLAASLTTAEKLTAEQSRSAEAAAAAKARELVQYTKLRDEQQAALQLRHDERVGQVTECTAKNDRLVKLSAELLDRYRKKTVSDVLKQREPVLGLGEVETFNLVQEYRDKADAERYNPSTSR